MRFYHISQAIFYGGMTLNVALFGGFLVIAPLIFGLPGDEGSRNGLEILLFGIGSIGVILIYLQLMRRANKHLMLALAKPPVGSS